MFVFDRGAREGIERGEVGFFFTSPPTKPEKRGKKHTDERAVAAASIAALLDWSIGEELKQRTEEAAVLFHLRTTEKEKSDAERRGSSLFMRRRSRRRSSSLLALVVQQQRPLLAPGPAPPPASGNDEACKEAVVARVG